MADGNRNERPKNKRRGNSLLYMAAVLLTLGAVAAAGWLFLFGGMSALCTKVDASSVQSGQSASVSQSPSSSQAVSMVSASSSQAVSTADASSAAASTAGASSSQAVAQSGAVMIGDAFTAGLGIYGGVSPDSLLADNNLTSATALTGKTAVGGVKLSYPQAAAAKNPTKIYILLGSNDVTWMTVQNYTANYSKFIDALKSACPKATIYAESVFPVKSGYTTGQGVALTNDKIAGYNSALQTLCTGKGVKYLDVASALKGPDGGLSATLSGDGFHLNKSGYQKWMDYLRSHS